VTLLARKGKVDRQKAETEGVKGAQRLAAEPFIGRRFAASPYPGREGKRA